MEVGDRVELKYCLLSGSRGVIVKIKKGTYGPYGVRLDGAVAEQCLWAREDQVVLYDEERFARLAQWVW